MKLGNLCLALLAYVVIAPALAAQPPSTGADRSAKSVDRVLRAMDNTPTDGHPDQYYEFRGMHAYVAGDYASAMHDFLQSARYADKLSQLSIGLMYLNGQGVAKDPVAAFAWTAIAAERQYPQFLATRDRIWSQLDASQRERAKAMVATLYTEYGDASAKPRMAKILRREIPTHTGSLLGFGGQSVASLTPAQLAAASGGNLARFTAPLPNCAGDTIDGAPMTGCGSIYVNWRWNPKEYFQVRDGAWKGTVTVGAISRGDASQGQPGKHPDAGS